MLPNTSLAHVSCSLTLNLAGFRFLNGHGYDFFVRS